MFLIRFIIPQFFVSDLAAPSTRQTFGGVTPAQKYPALANSRHKRTIIHNLRKENQPVGSEMAGM